METSGGVGGGRQLAPGEEFGGYLVEAVAGRGGMGVVYRARQRRPERVVALKVITPELAEGESFRARFERESNVAAQIEHPNVIPVYEVNDHIEVQLTEQTFRMQGGFTGTKGEGNLSWQYRADENGAGPLASGPVQCDTGPLGWNVSGG